MCSDHYLFIPLGYLSLNQINQQTNSRWMKSMIDLFEEINSITSSKQYYKNCQETERAV